MQFFKQIGRHSDIKKPKNGHCKNEDGNPKKAGVHKAQRHISKQQLNQIIKEINNEKRR